MKKRNGLFLKTLLYTGLVFVGIIVGIAIRHYYSMPIMDSLDIVGLGTLITTIFLAIYIPAVLDKQLQVKKDKKELIEQRIIELQSLFRKINLIVQSEEKLYHRDFLLVKNTLDIIQYKLDTITALLSYAKFASVFQQEIGAIKKLCKEHFDLLSSPAKEDDLLVYADDVQGQEELLFGKIDKAACLLIIKISEE